LVPSIVAFDQTALQINSPSPTARNSDHQHDGSGSGFAEFLESRPVADEPRPPAPRAHAHGKHQDTSVGARASNPARQSKPASAVEAKRQPGSADQSKPVEDNQDSAATGASAAQAETGSDTPSSSDIAAALSAANIAELPLASAETTAAATSATAAATEPALPQP